MFFQSVFQNVCSILHSYLKYEGLIYSATLTILLLFFLLTLAITNIVVVVVKNKLTSKEDYM